MKLAPDVWQMNSLHKVNLATSLFCGLCAFLVEKHLFFADQESLFSLKESAFLHPWIYGSCGAFFSFILTLLFAAALGEISSFENINRPIKLKDRDEPLKTQDSIHHASRFAFLIWTALGLPVVATIGSELYARTHHRGLAAVTFAFASTLWFLGAGVFSGKSSRLYYRWSTFFRASSMIFSVLLIFKVVLTFLRYLLQTNLLPREASRLSFLSILICSLSAATALMYPKKRDS